MNKRKEDFLAIGVFSAITIILVLLTVRGEYIYGSTLDFESQHFRIPEYLRLLFYSTHDLFPDFAMNIGGGQNIYNFSYYGFLSPVILLSYLMPFVSMLTFINISSVLLILISAILFYFFLRKKKFSYTICFISGLIFLCASPLLFHTHRHIMFVNYMPFMVMGLFGVDNYFDKNKSLLLIISVFLMIMTSYYFSVSGIFALVVYGMFRLLEHKITFKKFVISLIKFAVPFIIAILMSSILILPTFVALLSNRSETSVSVDLLNLFIPKMNNRYIFYYHYGLGLTSIALFSLCNGVTSKKRNLRYLSILLFVLILFPICNFIMNATMYVDAKILIPFLPLYVLVIANCLNDIYKNKIDKKVYLIFIVFVILSMFGGYYELFILVDALVIIFSIILSRKSKKKHLFSVSVLIITLALGIYMTGFDNLIANDDNYLESFEDQKEIVNKIISNDGGIYRISVQDNKLQNVNNIFDINYYSSTVYSSLNNQLYNSYYYDYMNNEIQSRNRSIISSVNNNLFLMASGNKYIVSSGRKLIGYNYEYEKDGYFVYKNDDVLPLGYVSDNLLSEEYFDKLNSADKKIALYRNVIVDEKGYNNYLSSLYETRVDVQNYNNSDIEVSRLDAGYKINVKKDSVISIPLNDELKNKILFINFDILKSWRCGKGDLVIEINGVSNKLTCGNWKYHNNNYSFEYVIGDDNRNSIDVTLLKGEYYIGDVKMYTSSYEDILYKNYDEFIITKINGDVIEGNVTSNKDGYFVLSIPYDDGFNISVDGKEVSYENVNKGLIGFEVNRGYHEISIEYEAPFKNVAMMLSCLGVISFGLCLYLEKRKNK